MARKTPDPTADAEPLELILLERDAPPPRGLARPALLAGVTLACLAGAGAGLWARPAMEERRLPAPAPVRAQALPELQVVVDEAPPPPIGAPLQVLEIIPGPSAMSVMPWSLPSLSAPPPPPPVLEAAPLPEPGPQVAPRRAPEGLVRVAARESAPEPAPRKADKPVEKKPAAKPKKKDEPAAKVAEKKKPKVERSSEKKLAAREKRKPKDQLAKVETKTKIAPKNAAKVPEKKVAAVKPKAKAKAAPVKVALAKLKPAAPKTKPVPVKAAAPKVEKAVLRPPSAAPAPTPQVVAPKPAAVQIAQQQVPQAPRNPCAGLAGADALVCADPGLRAAEREMSRAYRTAEDAGVPSNRLRQQQRRWLAAREAAANEAPWAVRDVYEARISELEDLSRDYSQP